MEIIRGKHTSFIETLALAERLAGYDTVHIDIGTGDGRFVRHMAATRPHCFVIGIDACRENLCEVSRRTPENALFVIANALALPLELHGLATQITINFPWGSLLEGLTSTNPALLAGLAAIARPNTRLEVRLNGGALTEVGWSLEEGAKQVRDVLTVNGFEVRSRVTLTAQELRTYPTTWAKRLAYGRDPRAAYLYGARQADIKVCGANMIYMADPS
jgi:16S rRNA (adenine(1408)-N(1))-methyltransferase